MRQMFPSLALIKTNFYLFVLISVFANTSYGQVPQNGYFINNNGDTVIGSMLLSNEMDAFQLIKGNEKTTYFSADIKTLQFENGKHFISTILTDPGKKVFLEVLLKGSVSLYKFKETLFMESSTEAGFIELKQETTSKTIDGRTYEVSSNAYQGVLNYMLKDCKKITPSKISTTPLNEVAITKLIKHYYSCTNQTVIDHKSDKKNLAINWGLQVNPGISFFKLSPSNAPVGLDENVEWNPSFFIPAGIFFELYSERSESKLKFRQEILYTQHTNTGSKTEIFNGDDEEVNEFTFSSKAITSNFLLVHRYLNKENISSFLFIGPSLNFVIDSENKRIFKTRFSQTSEYNTTISENFFEQKKFYFGLMAGIGVEKSVSKKYSILIDSRFSISSCSYTDLDYESKNNTSSEFNIQLSIGLIKRK